MKKVIFILFAVAGLLVSCSTAAVSSQATEPNAELMFYNPSYTVQRTTYADADKILAESKASPTGPVIIGRYGERRPNWVIQDLTVEEIFFGVGYSNLSDENDARRIALVEARNALAEKVYLAVDETITTYNSDFGKAYEIYSKQKAKAILTGVATEDEWVAQDGTVYVLVSIPVANVVDQMIMNIKTTDTLDKAKLQELLEQKTTEQN